MIYTRQSDDPFNAIIAGFVTGGVLAIRGGMNVAFKNAMVGGVILGLIEGVSIIITSVSMRRQYAMMEEMQKVEMAKIKAMQKRGGANPWEVDYDPEKAKFAVDEDETLQDKAKSFSF